VAAADDAIALRLMLPRLTAQELEGLRAEAARRRAYDVMQLLHSAQGIGSEEL
jgi:hypothetical protein